MAKHMRIGILIGRVYKEINREVIRGILNQAYSLGYSASVFTMIEENYDEKMLKGEMNILNLINFSLLDGLIFVPDSFSTDSYRFSINEFLQKNCTVPIVCIGSDFPCYPSVALNETNEIASIVRHLIIAHNCRKIYCLTGYKELKTAQARLDGYKQAMTEAGISYSDDDIFYGDFWHTSAEELGDKIVVGQIPVPDAIVCTNDIMAISLCDTLIAGGISVPGKVLVTGYDGTWETGSHTPPVTTYQTSWKMLGQRTMCRLFEIMTGSACEMCPCEEGTLITRESCGCHSDENDHSAPDIAYQIMEDNYLDSNLSIMLFSTTNLNEFAHALCALTYVFMDHVYYEKESYCLCLCEDWDSFDSDKFRSEGYSENMIFANALEEKPLFPVKDMFPPGTVPEGPSVSFFTPVHFQDQCFGYAIHTIDGVADGFNLHYLRFCREINNGLSFLYVQNKLKSLAYRKYLSETRDDLTGFYNFSYFDKVWAETAEKARIYGESTFLVSVVINGLRQISETYGTEESDMLVSGFSSMLMSCCPDREICLRENEDSFVVIGIKKEESDKHERFIVMLNEKIEQFNQSSAKPYKLRIQTALKVFSNVIIPDTQQALQEAKKLVEEARNAPVSYSEQLYYSRLVALRQDIYQYPEKTWSLDICCRSLGVSLSHFQRLYRATFGASCMHDVQKSKLTHAKKLLVKTDMTLQAIAECCGYDYSHFMRIFKKEFGMTPTKYRSGFAENLS
ncbi:MAG: helix-turn-helix domain-containing protein [Ruminococcus sp.]|nr:helix-turn-helix domain-containing protein [Ruminococcus sp.]